MGIRYRKICSQIDKHHYNVFGCGAIGSSAALCLAKHNAKHFYLYDNDTVSPENIGISMYSKSDIGKFKVEALTDILELEGTNKNIDKMGQIHFNKTWLDSSSVLNCSRDGLNFGILCFDNMFSRLEIARLCFDSKFDYVIDARMGREQIQLYTIKNIETYEKYWYPDSKASSDTCEEKGTPDVSMISGSLITSQIRKIVNKQPYPEEICFHIPSMALECNTMVK